VIRSAATNPKYGKGTWSLDDADGATVPLNSAEVADALRQRFNSTAYKPPVLPDVALQLNQLSRRPDVSIDQVVDLLQKDSVLAGRILKLVQSPMYCGQMAIRSLRQAVIRLGLNAMRNCVLEVALSARIFRSKAYGPPLELLRRHSLATAHFTKLIAGQAGLDAEFGFLCGLLHDVGMAGALLALAEGKEGAPVPIELAWPAVDQVHEESSAMLLRLWHLPEDLAFIVGNHHRVSAGGRMHPMVASITTAHTLCDAFKLGLGANNDGRPIETNPPDTLAAACRTLGLADKMPSINTAASGMLKEIAALIDAR
jgi:HD-like signal output (HDOD) protein